VIAIPVPLCVSVFTASDNISCLGEHSGVLVHQVTARIGRQGRQVRVLDRRGAPRDQALDAGVGAGVVDEPGFRGVEVIGDRGTTREHGGAVRPMRGGLSGAASLRSWLSNPPWLRWGRRCRFSACPT